ncbi:helix-turn-helix domain-containing protein [Achromobacter sp.]|uniref:helix-turn-helix domain-containing protein n=1 Tax=Achromobacter sp. TaxID=134375 RepID=UPI002F932573
MATKSVQPRWINWSNAKLPPSEQFDAWRDRILAGIVAFSPAIQRSRWAQPFPCVLEMERFDDLFISHSTLSPQNLARGSAEMSRDRFDMYTVVLSSSAQQMQYGRDVHVTRLGSLYLLDNCDPLTASIAGHTSQITVHIPRQRLAPLLLPSRRQTLFELTGGGNGIGNIAAGMIRNVVAYREQFDATAKDLVANHLVALIAAAAGATTDAQALGAHAVRHEQHLAVCRHIEKHLPDPDMSALTVAKHFRISPRYLHKLFEPSGKSFAQTVIHLRLVRCGKELANAPGHIAISEIAYRSGFGDLSNFSRAFRRMYGASPRDYRNACRLVLIAPKRPA